MNSVRTLVCGIMTGFHPNCVVRYLRETVEQCKKKNRRKRALIVASKLLTSHRQLRLEIGSGGFHRDGWIGVDLSSTAELQWDLREPLPFPDGSVAEIHSEHCLEHFDFPDQLKALLRECWRVLEKNGIISFSVPNIRPLLEAYVSGNRAFLEDRISDVPDVRRQDYLTDLDLVNWFALRGGDHRCMFDAESAMQRLKEAGFRGIHVREFDSQRDYNFRRSSVYVEGRK